MRIITNHNFYKTALTPFQKAISLFRQNKIAMLGALIVLLLFITSIFGFDLVDSSTTEYVLIPPVWYPNGSFSFLLGTDDLGRNILYRLIQGAHLTFRNALIIAFLSLCIGVSIGIITVLFRNIFSRIFFYILDIFLAIPSLLIAILGVAILGATKENAFIAITLALIPKFVHTTHQEICHEMNKEYITALRLDGASKNYILFNVVLPNVIEPIIIQFTRALSAAILDISAIGFLRLGFDPDSPEWGTMLADASDLVYIAPWTITLPGLTIMISILSVNLFGEGIRQAIHESRR